MNRQIRTLLIVMIMLMMTGQTKALERWEAPFKALETTVISTDSVLTFQAVIGLVAAKNQLLASLDLRLKAAQGGIIQASVKPNPELEAEIEDVGWDAPGFDESELAISLSQEFELFGQRGARQKVAEAELLTSKLEVKLEAFDLFLEVQALYYYLAHAQGQADLSNISIKLAEDIVSTIKDRIEKGAALESELLLAQLEVQRAKLARDEAALNVETAIISLVSLWAGDPTGVRVDAGTEPDIEALLQQMSGAMTDSSRELLALERQQEQLTAELRLTTVETKPNLTLSSGYKRVSADNSNSLFFGLSLPLPFRNQNRGALQSLEAELEQLSYDRKQAQLDNKVLFNTSLARLRQLNHHQLILSSELLPIAEKAYEKTQTLYQLGRLPYTNLLEANRVLVELKFEQNDIVLALREQIIELERVEGIILLHDKDQEND